MKLDVKLDPAKFLEYIDVEDPERIIFNRAVEESGNFKHVGECGSPCDNCEKDEWYMKDLPAVDEEGDYLSEYYENSGVDENVRVYLCDHCSSWSIATDC